MIKILCADALEGLRTLPNDSVSMCVTSPPYYGLRDYGNAGQIGIEDSPEQYIQKLTAVFREVRRVLRPDGTLWLNIADSYAGSGKGIGRKPTHCKHSYQIPADSAAAAMPTTWNAIKPKDMIGIPWMLAFALRADGWYLRSDIIWNKINCLPESVKDRPTKSYEHLFLFAKSSRYYYNAAAIMEPAAESSLKRALVETSMADFRNRASMGQITTNECREKPCETSEMSGISAPTLTAWENISLCFRSSW